MKLWALSLLYFLRDFIYYDAILSIMAAIKIFLLEAFGAKFLLLSFLENISPIVYVTACVLAILKPLKKQTIKKE